MLCHTSTYKNQSVRIATNTTLHGDLNRQPPSPHFTEHIIIIQLVVTQRWIVIGTAQVPYLVHTYAHKVSFAVSKFTYTETIETHLEASIDTLFLNFLLLNNYNFNLKAPSLVFLLFL